ncbi:ABC transporter permease [Nocardia sp. NBC_00416]|uniref:ABC transporter permease n=1 Tax=Nocardia sp. NBC_00416 TaxID=2975991 RepID=UPI002E24F970
MPVETQSVSATSDGTASTTVPGLSPAEPAQGSAGATRRVPVSMLLGRLVAIPVSIFAVATLAFWLVRLPGTNAAAAIGGEYADAEAIARIEGELGFDRPLWSQYTDFLAGLVRGDLGASYFTRRPVSEEIFGRLPLDLTVGLLALVVAIIVGVGMGAVGAYYRTRPADHTTRVIVSVLQSLPEYVFALVLVYVFFYLLGVAPAPVGQVSMRTAVPDGPTGVVVIDALLAGDTATFGKAAQQLVLPVLSFGLVLSAVFARVTRTNFATVLASPQIHYARACGLTPLRVFWSAFTVSRTAVLTTIAVITGAIIGGGAIMQKIYNLNGAAAFGVDSIFKFDLPVIQGIVIVLGGLTVLTFLVIDIVILLLDPRVRHKS